MTLKKASPWLLAALLTGTLAVSAAASPESDAIKAAGTTKELQLITLTVPADWTPGRSQADTSRSSAFAVPALNGNSNCFTVEVESRFAPSEKVLLKKLAEEAAKSKKAGAEPFGIERVTVAGAPAYSLVTKTYSRIKGGNGFYSKVMIAGEWPYGYDVGSKVGTFLITFERSTMAPEESFKKAFESGTADPALQAVLETLRFNDPDVNAWFAERRAQVKAQEEHRAAIEAKLFELDDSVQTPEKALRGEWTAENAPTLVFGAGGVLTIKGAWKADSSAVSLAPFGALSFNNNVVEMTAQDGTKVTYVKSSAAPDAAQGAATETWKLTGAMLRDQPMDAAKATHYFSNHNVVIEILANGLVKTNGAAAGLCTKDGAKTTIELIKGPLANLPFELKDGKLTVRRSPVVTLIYEK